MSSMREFPDNQSPDIGPLARPDEPTPVPDLRRLGRRSRDYGRARDPCRRRRGDYLSQRDDLSDDGRRATGRGARHSGRKDSCRGIGFRRVRPGARRDPDRRPSGPHPVPGVHRPAPSHRPFRAVRGSAAQYRLPEILESRRGACRAESGGRQRRRLGNGFAPATTTTCCRVATCLWGSWMRSRPSIRFLSFT